MKLKPVINGGTREQIGWFFFCEGCGEPHCVRIGPEGWTFNGDENAPTFSPSIKVTYHDGQVCHSNIANGIVMYGADSTHALAGKDVPMSDYPASWM